MSPWLWAAVISAPLVALAVLDVQVARELRRADGIVPRIPFLTLVTGVVYGVTVGAVIFAALGINNAVFLLTGIRLLPQPVPLLAIYVGAIAASLAVFRLRRWLRGQR